MALILSYTTRWPAASSVETTRARINLPEDATTDKVGKMGSLYRGRYLKDATFEALKVIEHVVEKHNLTLLETALRCNFDQLQANLKDLEKGPLPDGILKTLDEGG
ncbi:MAG: hypothetical protein M1836_006838 [Candelina mexicana]|nr:MAG: hypothetical protein M1836_006838 [Candelina mexicana]